MSTPTVLRLGANPHPCGRDFVVGDLHGTFDLLLQAMKRVQFNPAHDRLFSVGDLIDRGPDSARVTRFLAQPFVFAVRGNHEDLLLSLDDHGGPSLRVINFLAHENGFGWWRTTPEEERQQIIQALRRLPLAIEIETHRGTVGLIHAEVPRGMDWPTFIDQLEAGDGNTLESCLSGRERVKAGDESGVPGIGRIFAGHSWQGDGPRMLGNLCIVDTGAVFGALGQIPTGHLTLARLTAATSYLTAPRKDPAQPIEVRDHPDIPTRRFGALAAPSMR